MGEPDRTGLREHRSEALHLDSCEAVHAENADEKR